MHDPDTGAAPGAISVIVPCKDREPALARALASIRSQTRLPDEIIVIDDGSEKPLELASADDAATPIRVVRNPVPTGPARARNRGLEAASGRYIFFLDSDDVWLPRYLEGQLANLAAHQGGCTVASYAVVRDGHWMFEVNPRVPLHVDALFQFKGGPFVTSVIGFDRRSLEGPVWFRDLPAVEDFVFVYDLWRAGAVPAATRDVLVRKESSFSTTVEHQYTAKNDFIGREAFVRDERHLMSASQLRGAHLRLSASALRAGEETRARFYARAAAPPLGRLPLPMLRALGSLALSGEGILARGTRRLQRVTLGRLR